MEFTASRRPIRGNFRLQSYSRPYSDVRFGIGCTGTWGARWLGDIDRKFFLSADVVQLGIDLPALVVVRVPKADAIARAGEKLLRSGGFGLVVLDLGRADIPTPLQSSVDRNRSTSSFGTLICLTEKDSKAFSLGSLVSLRVHAERKKANKNQFACGLCMSSKINGEVRPGRMRNCGMYHRDCAELGWCLHATTKPIINALVDWTLRWP